MIVGILGCGAIANLIVQNVNSDNTNIKIKYFYDRDCERAENLASIAGGIAVYKLEDMLDKVDLVLEAASQESVRKSALKIIESGTDMITMSVGALMDEDLREVLSNAAKKYNTTIYAPSGAVSGIDGIKAASVTGIDSITLTTRKSPKSLGREITEEEILFEGKASEAVKEFPMNINVAASLSLASDMDINVKIIVDPKVSRNVHEVEVKGSFGQLKTTTMNFPCTANPKTSMLAALSAIKLLRSLDEHLIIGT
ncbi:aspartate dehydrogenase [uncultured Methanobrevibacter sp.]|uniref:aspartate dehydrogenase n=1 Tax=uncultured Methanobrevibacter sp. TaxID=253161 RepID=UPI00260128C9|nr:aspartate dehydrogenase [uncultured Methanobrevibacter sp.]